MRVYQFNNLPSSVGSTATLQDFETIMGKKPYLAKEVVKSTTDKNLTLLRIAEDFGDKLYTKSSTTESDSLVYDWMVETGTRIPKIYIAEDCSDTTPGLGVSEFSIILDRLYYTLGCIFELENEQQLMVSRMPEKLAENKWRYFVKPVTPSRTVSISTTYLTKGKYTRYISKASIVPEMHDFGGSYKDEFNIERHRQYVSRFRMESSKSGDAALFLPNVIDLGQGGMFKQTNVETKLMADLLESVNRAGLFAAGNVDDKFNVLTTTDDGRTIPIGQGILPQVKAYANFMPYQAGKFTVQKMKDVINEVVARKEKKTGNEIIVICNYKLFQEIQSTLDPIAGARLTTQDYYFNEAMKDRWVLGADYAGYRFSGNKILFMEETALSNQYPDKGYGLVFNLYAETASGKKPNVQEVTIKGMPSIVKSYINGVGGQDGKTSGIASSKIHASQVIMFKYSSFIVNDPYGTMFIQETTY